MEKEKKDLSFILILLSTLIGIAVLFQWAIVNGLYVPVRNQAMWEKLLVKGIMFRFLYVILIAGLAFLFPYNLNMQIKFPIRLSQLLTNASSQVWQNLNFNFSNIKQISPLIPLRNIHWNRLSKISRILNILVSKQSLHQFFFF